MTIIVDEDVLPPLLPDPQTFVVDPAFANTVEMAYDTVAVGQPTQGPNRYTVHVPKETTVLSLGAASPRWVTDVGITGYTDSHIHFETKAASKTIVSLGGPATTSAVKGYGDAAPVSTHGYSMVTQMNAWHDSLLQHYLLAQEEDITVRTMGAHSRAVLQAAGGFVDVNGGKEVNVSGGGVSIGARNALPFEDIEYAKALEGETPHSLAAKRASTATNIAAAASTAHSLAVTAMKLREEYKHGHLHASVDTFADVVEWLADLGEFTNLAAEVHEGFSDEEASEEKIKIDGEVDVGGAAGGEAAFFGVKGATIASAVWGGVSGVIAASLQGTLFGGIAGAYTSVKGYASVEVGCAHGDAHFDAGKNVEIAAEKSAFLVAKELVQVSSKGNAYFAGEKKVWVGTAAGGGWGLLLSADGAKLGKASGADKMASASIESDRSIAIDAKGFTLKSASTEYTQNNKGVTAKSGSVKFHAKDSDVSVKGKKVLIDGP